jgi:hypothetical protein
MRFDIPAGTSINTPSLAPGIHEVKIVRCDARDAGPGVIVRFETRDGVRGHDTITPTSPAWKMLLYACIYDPRATPEQGLDTDRLVGCKCRVRVTLRGDNISVTPIVDLPDAADDAASDNATW